MAVLDGNARVEQTHDADNVCDNVGSTLMRSAPPQREGVVGGALVSGSDVGEPRREPAIGALDQANVAALTETEGASRRNELLSAGELQIDPRDFEQAQGDFRVQDLPLASSRISRNKSRPNAPREATPTHDENDAGTTSLSSNAGVRLVSLLKVSPPMPVGRVPGRFKVRLRRASTLQPFGVVFGRSKQRGVVVIGDEMPHLGLRRGDEVLYLNNHTPSGVRHCSELLLNALDVEIQLLHREEAGTTRRSALEQCMCNESICKETPQPAFYEVCFNPPPPKCTATSWPLRDVLLTSGPVLATKDQGLEQNGAVDFNLTISRTSLKQPFALGLSASSSRIVGVQQPQRFNADRGAKGCAPSTASSERVTCAARTTSVGSGEDTYSIDDFDLNDPNDSAFSWHEEPAEEIFFAQEASVDASSSASVLMIVKESLPHYGLREGDQLMQINGVPVSSIEVCQSMLKAATVVLKFRRIDQHVPVLSMKELPLADIEVDEPIGSVSFGSFIFSLVAPLRCCMGNPSADSTVASGGFNEGQAYRRTSAATSKDAVV